MSHKEMLHYFFHGIPVLFAASQLETIGTSINYDQHRKISWKIPWKWLFKFISEKLRLHCIQISHKESHKKSDWIPWIPNDVRTTEGSGCESQKSKKNVIFWFHMRSLLNMFTLNPFVCPKVKPGQILPFCHPPAVCLAVCLVEMLSWKI